MTEFHTAGRPKFNEEAQFLSYIYVVLRYAVPDSAIIKRLRTTPLNKGVNSQDRDIYI